MNIAINSWCAWQPEGSGLAKCLSYKNGESTTSEFDKPALDNIPPMQKRRLSKLARIVFHVLDHCVEQGQQTPVVFSSVMGEIKRTQGILEAIANDSPVSPASFSLSVHNSISGLWSLVRNNTAPMFALAPTGGSPVAALVEAAGILAEGRYDAVTVVLYEEDYPSFYHPFLRGPAAPCALAMQLVGPALQPNSGGIAIDLERVSTTNPVPPWESDLDLLGLLTGAKDSLLISEPQASWRLDRRN